MIVLPLPTLKLVDVLSTKFSGKGVIPAEPGPGGGRPHPDCNLSSSMLERNQNQPRAVCVPINPV